MKISGKISAKGNVSGKLGRADRVNIKELTFANRFEFPSIGEADKMYIATDENAVYRYDEADRAYYCIGRDYKNIEVINGGNSNGG